jgi:hypothetical protein
LERIENVLFPLKKPGVILLCHLVLLLHNVFLANFVGAILL